MSLFATEHPFTTGVDISSSAFWAKPFAERDESFARLRRDSPVSWHPPTDSPQDHAEKGFWAVTRAADISAISVNSRVFESKNGTSLTPLDVQMATAASFFLTMDPPEHSKYRRLISAAFTPKAVGRLTEQIERNAAAIVDSLAGSGDVDFVAACSSRLPMMTVADIVGVEGEHRERLALAAERLVGGADIAALPLDEVYEALTTELFLILQTGMELAAHRRRHPADDLMTNLVQAQVDGVGLTDDEIGAFLVLISVAGNDTTKQTTSLGMLALQEFQDQRKWLIEDLPSRLPGAVEEIVRWVSPVMQFTRTAAEDTEVGGAQIAQGDKVALFYCSANRDASLFTDPDQLNLDREKNPHFGFGGGGPHFCLGNGLARTQLHALYRQLLTRVPGIEFGEMVPLSSNFINGAISLTARIP